MKTYEINDYKVFDLFRNQWALVTAGTLEHFNTCTISWGSLGTLWTRPNGNGSVITVYIHPGRYTCDFLKENDVFTVSFFSTEHKKALAYLGAHSGRSENKVEASGLTPIPVDHGVTFQEATMTFVCHKLYGQLLSKDGIADDVRDYYIANPSVYPPDEHGDWQPHWMFIGEIIDTIEH